MSNNNFLLMKDCKKVFVRLPKAYFVARCNSADAYKLEQELTMFDQINKLIEINCDMVVDKEVKTIDAISNEILEQLKKA